MLKNQIVELLNQHKTVDEIISIAKCSKVYVYRVMQSLNGNNVAVGTANTTQEPGEILNLSMEVKNNKVVLNVKACEEYEAYLKKHKEVKTTQNLFGRSTEGKFYHMSAVNGHLDDINKPIFYLNSLNFAILRVVGISQGVSLEIKGLITEDNLQRSLKELLVTFKGFYQTKVKHERKLIQGQVIENV